MVVWVWCEFRVGVSCTVFWVWIQGVGSRVQGSGLGVQSLGFRVYNIGFRV